jgi:hypothetical protein
MFTNYINKNGPITSLIYGIRGGVANKKDVDIAKSMLCT